MPRKALDAVPEQPAGGLLSRTDLDDGGGMSEARKRSIVERAEGGFVTDGNPATYSGEDHIGLVRDLRSRADERYTERMKLYARLEQALQIDKMQLDDELMQLPFNTQEVNEKCANAIGRRDQAAHMLKVITAHAANRLRNAKMEGSKELSAATIAAELPLCQDVIEATRVHHSFHAEAAMWQALVGSWDVKRSALRATVELISSGYISAGSIHGDRRQQMRDARIDKDAQRGD